LKKKLRLEEFQVRSFSIEFSISGRGRWAFVKPAALVPFNHGDDTDYDCLDRSAVVPATSEYATKNPLSLMDAGSGRF
jgi:hypothetical protein